MAIFEGVPSLLAIADFQQGYADFAQEFGFAVLVFVVNGDFQNGMDIFDGTENSLVMTAGAVRILDSQGEVLVPFWG